MLPPDREIGKTDMLPPFWRSAPVKRTGVARIDEETPKRNRMHLWQWDENNDKACVIQVGSDARNVNHPWKLHPSMANSVGTCSALIEK